jgi:hypothetical protein
MAGFFIPDPRFEMPSLLEPGRKPVGPVEIDWSHPLAVGLVGYYLLNSRVIVNLVNGKNFPLTNAVLSANTIDFTGTTGGLDIDVYTDDIFPAGTYITSGHAYDASTNWCFYIEAGIGGDGLRLAELDSAGRIFIATNNQDWAGSYISLGAEDQHADNRLIAFRWDTLSNLRTVNTPFSSHVDSATSLSDPASNYQLRIGARATYGDLPAGKIYFSAIYNRYISDVEEKSFRANPQQMLIPK